MKVCLTRLSILIISLYCVGCSNKVLVIDDHNAPIGVLRVTKQVKPRFGIELEMSHTQSSDQQELEIEEELHFGLESIIGPKSLHHDLDHNMAAIIVDFIALDRERFKLHVGVGLRYSKISISTRIQGDTDDSLNIDITEQGATLTSKLVFPIVNRFEAQLRSSLSFYSEGSLELHYKFTNHFRSFGGWYRSRYVTDDFDSGLKVYSSGFRYGLQFDI